MNNGINAIILAAGKGERMRPLTKTTPKPLIQVNGIPMIENIIQSLLKQGIKDIVVVVGYMKESFEYLKKKYNVTIVENPDYEFANNISSLYYAREFLSKTLILDGDQIINNVKILTKDYRYSGYFCWKNVNYSAEWILNLDDNHFITSCSRDGGECGYELKSVSYWNEKDSTTLKKYLIEEYHKNNKLVYWDDIAMFLHKESFKLCGYIIDKNDILEIDTLEELRQVDWRYRDV